MLLLEGKFDEAGRSYPRALEIRRRVLAPQSPDIAVSLLGLGLALAQEEESLADAEAPLREALGDPQRGCQAEAVAYRTGRERARILLPRAEAFKRCCRTAAARGLPDAP